MFGFLWKTWQDVAGITALRGEIALLTAKVKAQDDILYQVGKDKLTLAQDKIELQRKLAAQIEVANVLNVRLLELNSNIDSLKTELAQNGVEVPTTKPSFIGTGYCYRPNIQVEGTDVSVSNPCDIYTRSDLLCRSLGISSLKSLPKSQKVRKIWEYVIKAIEYRYDKQDNWQLHPITVLRRYGDCEDGTILFLDCCRAAGIPASEVFNFVGNTSFGYHSYPCVYFKGDEADSGEGWYIFETTLDFLPDKPKKLNGSKYWCEGGIQNWLYFGSVKPEFATSFNGVTMPSTRASPQKMKIENNKEKREMIKKHWRGET